MYVARYAEDALQKLVSFRFFGFASDVGRSLEEARGMRLSRIADRKGLMSVRRNQFAVKRDWTNPKESDARTKMQKERGGEKEKATAVGRRKGSLKAAAQGN